MLLFVRRRVLSLQKASNFKTASLPCASAVKNRRNLMHETKKAGSFSLPALFT